MSSPYDAPADEAGSPDDGAVWRRPEPLIGSLVNVLLAVRLPAVAAWAAAVGSHAVAAARGVPSIYLFVAAFFGAAALWAWIGRRVAKALWPGDLALEDVAVGFGLPARPGLFGRLLKGGLVAFALQAVPWLGAVAGFALATTVPLFLHSGRGGVRVAAVILAATGAALIGVVSVSPRGGALIIAGLATATVAIGVIVTGEFARRYRAARADQCVIFLFGIAPVLVAWRTEAAVSWSAFAALCGLLLPASILAGVYLAFTRSRGRLADLIAGASPRRLIEPGARGARCEDPIRESDGYYRSCIPAYAHPDPARVGEAGYAATLGGAGEPVTRDVGAAVMIRANSDANPLTDYADGPSVRLSRLARRAILGLRAVVDEPRFDEVLLAADATWVVRRTNNLAPELMFKSPWESGEILVVPEKWQGHFVIPPGVGLVDRRGIPCQIPDLEVAITLSRRILAAADRPDRPGSAEILREFVARVPQMLPAVFEAVLDAAGRALLEMAAPVGFQDDKEANRDAEGLPQAINARLSLAPGVTGLVDVAILSARLDPYLGPGTK